MPTDLSVLNETLINRRLNEEVLHYDDSSSVIELVFNFLTPEDLARVCATQFAFINGAGNVALRRSGRSMDECVICLEPVTVFGETFIHPSCGNRFHRRCWVANMNYGNPCPLCRGADTGKSFSALAPYFVWAEREEHDRIRERDEFIRAVVHIFVDRAYGIDVLQPAWDEFYLLTQCDPVVLVKYVSDLVPMLKSRVRQCRYVVLKTLCKLEPAMLRAYAGDVVSMLKDKCFIIRAMALETMSYLEQTALTAYADRVFAMLGDESVGVHMYALQTLRKIDPGVLADAHYAGSVVRILITDKDPFVSCTALYALTMLDSSLLTPYAGAVARFLSNNYDFVRLAALQTMGVLGADDLIGYVDTIILLLQKKEENIDVRFEAFKALREFEPSQYLTRDDLRAFHDLLLLRPYDSMTFSSWRNPGVNDIDWDV